MVAAMMVAVAVASGGQHPAKADAVPDSRELNNTLDKLRASVRQQTRPGKPSPGPTNLPAGSGGGASGSDTAGGNGAYGGNPHGDITATLTGAQRGAIGDKVRRCWTKDAGAPPVENMQVFLLVTVDGGGVARQVVVAPEDVGRLGDPRFREFAERAVRAVLSPRCSTLPVPPTLLAGGTGVLKFLFRP
jgi:hypothetical protein